MTIFFPAWLSLYDSFCDRYGCRDAFSSCPEMLLTPPDVISQSLLAIPMYLLYEVGLLFGRLVRKRKEEKEAAEEHEADL